MEYIREEAGNSLIDSWKPIIAVALFDAILTVLILLLGNTNVFLLINQGLQLKQLDPIIALISNFGVILLIAGGVLIFTLDYKYKSIASLTLMLIGFWLAIFIGYSLKTYFDVLRPYYQLPHTRTLIFTSPDLGGSFPSSHALLSFFIWTIIAVKAKKYSIPTLIAAVLISFSRIYVGVHYPLDVTIGALIGIILGVSILSLELIAKRLNRNVKEGLTTSKPGLNINFNPYNFNQEAYL